MFSNKFQTRYKSNPILIWSAQYNYYQQSRKCGYIMWVVWLDRTSSTGLFINLHCVPMTCRDTSLCYRATSSSHFYNNPSHTIIYIRFSIFNVYIMVYIQFDNWIWSLVTISNMNNLTMWNSYDGFSSQSWGIKVVFKMNKSKHNFVLFVRFVFCWNNNVIRVNHLSVR